MKKKEQKNRFISRLTLTILMISISVMSFAQFTGEGAGTSDNPYQVANATHLSEVANFLGQAVFFLQTDDIDLTEEEEWEAIGDLNNRFQGNYNGNGFAIIGLTLETNAQYQGLFGYTNGATLVNINLQEVDITGGNYTGALVGRADNTTINNCYAGGEVTGASFVGGMLGRFTGTVNDSHANVNVTSENGQRIGGFTGDSWGNANRCSARGNVSGGTRVGGFAGNDYNGSHNQVFATGNVTGNNEVGGLFGLIQTAQYNDCYATGNVTGNDRVGGYVGRSEIAGTTNRCYSIGSVNVEGEGEAGGLIGSEHERAGNVNNSYWNVETSGQEESFGGEGRTTAQMQQQGNYAGWNFNTVWSIMEDSYPFLAWERGVANLSFTVGDRVVNLFWNHPIAGEPDGYRVYRGDALISGEDPIEDTNYRDDDDELQNFTTYTYGVAAVYDGVEFPAMTIRATPINLEGSGSFDDPFIIETVEHLQILRMLPNMHYRQGDDIQLEGNWSPIGPDANNQFTGSLDGDGYEISGLQTARAFRVGLFGYTNGAIFRNINLVDVNILASHESGSLVAVATDTQFVNCSVTGSFDHSTNFYFGGLVGRTVGGTSIHQCWTDMEMTGNGRIYIGGLVGQQSSTGDITESFTLGSLTTTNNNANLMMGGLVGYMTNGQVINCYSMASVTCPENNNQVGGLIGRTTRNVTNSFSTGMVSSAGEDVGGLIGLSSAQTVNSYWNIETSGQAESSGGEPLTTVQMLRQGSFENWDFGDDEPGIWSQDENSFPYLSWEGDEAGEHSIPSPIMPPSNLRAQIGEDRDQITILWDEPSIAQPQGYNVFRGGERINQQLVEDERFTDTNVQTWQWYSYTVTAVYIVDDEPEESTPSGVLRVIVDDFEGGTGTADDPFLVASEVQLRGVRFILNAHYRQTAHIDLSRQAWEPIGDNNNRFEGSFDGNDFVITEMNFNNNNQHQGLFGYINGATLNNITLEDVNIDGGNFTGALVGRADNSTINNCAVISGTVRGSSNVGGLIGRFTGTANDSYSAADVIATGDRIGGFSGDSWGNVNRCFATGDVEGNNRVGGFAGSDYNGSHNQFFATGNVEGNDEVGGLMGFIQTANYNDCYATGNVTGNTQVGGLIGNYNITGGQQVRRGYSIGRVTGQNEVGGLIGRLRDGGAPENCYWNVRTSGQEESPAGEGRDERHMTYPYTDDTYVGWNFDNIWEADEEDLNGGYPYFTWQPLFMQPFPDVARNPNPANNVPNVAVDIDTLRWSYISSEAHVNPIGFRVYFNDSGEFGEDDEFAWVPYVIRQEHYSTGDILPEEDLDYLTTYFWKVVPTVTDPDDDDDDRSIENRRRLGLDSREVGITSRGDAENVPVWRFTTEINPHPAAATDPIPKDEAEDVAIDLVNVGWTYTVDEIHTNPAGFRLYMNTTGEFEEDDDFVWVNFSQHQSNYTNAAILPEQLEYNQTYYWKVVPTTENPNRDVNLRRRGQSAQRYSEMSYRNDAEDVTVWSFTTIATDPNPQPATNPDPEHLATGISLGLAEVSWDYQPSEIFADPIGFRVYMNTTGAFGVNAPYIWVDYVEDQVTYSSSDILPLPLDANTTYYWRIIPTTIHPDDMRTLDDNRRRLNDKSSQRQSLSVRGDAQNCPVWRFTTGTTDIEGETVEPPVTELQNNYPNPFNPETNISFALAEASDVTIEVYNSRGQKVITLFDGYKESGRHTVVWNGRDSDNREVGSGIYFYRMKSGSYTSTNRMVLLK